MERENLSVHEWKLEFGKQTPLLAFGKRVDCFIGADQAVSSSSTHETIPSIKHVFGQLVIHIINIEGLRFSCL